MNSFRDHYQKNCPNCDEQFVARRLNQDYCSDECRIQFNNHKAMSSRRNVDNIATPINQILWKNREILRNFAGRKEVSLSELQAAGFLLNYITSFEQTDFEKSPRLSCYDYAYSFKDQQTLNIYKT